MIFKVRVPSQFFGRHQLEPGCSVDQRLRSGPLQASAWVDNNGNKEVFIAVAEFSNGRGDSEAANFGGRGPADLPAACAWAIEEFAEG